MAEQQKKFETPVNDDAEIAYLATLLINGEEVIRKTNHILEENDFYYQKHRYLYETCSDLVADGHPVDLVTISESLKSRGLFDEVGGYDWLIGLTNEAFTTIHAVHYAKIIAKYGTMRRILDAARDIGKMTQGDTYDFDKMLIKAEERLNGVTRKAAQMQNKLELVDLQDYMTKAREHREPEGTIKGLSTGLQKIDKMTQGFVPGELMIISGQTSHGKTQLANNIILNTVKHEHKVMFVTMEMTKQETADRFNMLTEDQDIGEGKIFLNMRSDLAYTDVTKLIERAKEKGCELVVIDHLHYFSRSVENATQEVSKIVKEFKQAAVMYEMPVILICHVRKMAPKKHPTLEDLRDSSLIAQDADMVLIVWRDESPNAKNPFEVEVTLWKNRNRQKKHRRDFLYAKGMRLEETDSNSEAAKQEAHDYAQQTARILGERDDDLEDLKLDW
jgi:replicative DNA helicase